MKFIIPIFTLLMLLSLPLTANAGLTLIPESMGCIKNGSCGLCDILFLVSNFAKLLLGFIGTIALVFFVIGGFMWITSAGSAEKVKKGQSLLANTLIGIVIVILAWFIVNFIITSIAGKPQIINSNTAWYAICKENKK